MLHRVIGELRRTVRVQLEPLLPDAAREAIQAIDADDSASATLKKSVRRLLVDQREFSNSFFTAVDSHIDAAINELLTGGEDKTAPTASDRALSLSLVEYDEMEEAMVIDRFSSRIRNAADTTFTPLTQRLAKALQIPGLGDRDNPFHPVRFCRALGDAIDKLGFKGDQRHSVLKAFDVSLLKPLVAVYTALNNDLEGKGVQEGAGASSFKPPGLRNTMIGGAGAAGRTTQGGQAPGSLTGTTAEQLLSALYQRMQVPTVPGGGRPVPAMPHSQLPSAPMFDRVDPITSAQMMSPGFVITGSASTPLAPGTPVQFAMIDPGLLASINEVQRLNAMATMAGKSGAAAQMISERDEAQLRSHVADKATKQIDKLTIELVGMLFDRIHQDKHLPAEIKTALSRLQFPIMKVALADSDLFVSPVQPARRLMDRIASTGIGWRPEGEDNVRFLSEVNKAVNTVVVAINEGPPVFEKALGEFEQYLADERVRDDDPVTRAKRALEEAETREIMAINAAIGIRRAFDGVQIESYLRDFLLENWVKVMVAATLRERTQPSFAKKFRDIVPDLVWSVQPKINPDDRKRLVKTIPAVLSTVREGLQLIEFSAAQSAEFFSRLMGSHAQAVKALEVAYGTGAPLDPAAFKRKLDEVKIVEPPPMVDNEPEQHLTITPEVVRSAVAANNAEVNLLEAPLTVQPEEMIPVEKLSDDRIDQMIDSWQRGTWFDLWTGEKTERVRLRWISPRKNFYLFTSADTGKAHSLAPLILRSYVRAGRIRTAERAPLFERVVDDMMH
ncbi:MAG: DUF1631 domain-containing protein, partial [Pseudomonadota bacterium]|nr:DUF1631 domain-containing protein [Pseudomonadota bacterium]